MIDYDDFNNESKVTPIRALWFGGPHAPEDFEPVEVMVVAFVFDPKRSEVLAVSDGLRSYPLYELGNYEKGDGWEVSFKPFEK